MATRQTADPWSTVKHGGFKRYSPGIKSRRKHKKKSKSQNIPILNGSFHGNISFKKLKQKTLKETEIMERTQLFKQFMIHFKSISSSNYKLLSKIKGIIKVNIMCYALGSFSESLSSMKQISFLCSIRNNLNDNHFSLNKIELFEPILSFTEKKVIKTFGIDILLKNKNGKYAMNDIDDNVITLFFMPHSPRILYNNLLETNWFNKHLLTQIYIVGNSFDQYRDLLLPFNNKNNEIYKEIKWIMKSKELNIIKELDMDKWIEIDDNIECLDSFRRDTISVMRNAFAFQKLMYFPVERIAKYDETEWIQTYDALLNESVNT